MGGEEKRVPRRQGFAQLCNVKLLEDFKQETVMVGFIVFKRLLF